MSIFRTIVYYPDILQHECLKTEGESKENTDYLNNTVQVRTRNPRHLQKAQ